MQTWILTFNRPVALNRQIDAFKSWTDVHVFSNHPHVQLTDDNIALYKDQKLNVLYNTLSDPESIAYTARSWNNIFLKAFKTEEEIICVQDDTHVTAPAAFRDLILDNKDRFDLIWGPAGDQFFYVKKKVLERVGWFDERYLGAYCGDADWLKRVWQQYDQSKLSIAEAHDWGFSHNSIGVERYIPTGIQSKACDPNYVNQDQEIQAKMQGRNIVLEHSQAHFCQKWGHMLNGTKPINRTDLPFGSLLAEIPWYPWFEKKYMERV
jgi:hypothetical protein